MQKRRVSSVNVILAALFLAPGLAWLAMHESPHAQAGDPNAARPPAVALEMGLHLSSEGTSAAFVLTNSSDQPFKTTPIATNYNRLVIVTPDGKTHERFSWKDGIPPVVVAPGAVQTWKLELAKMPEFKEKGLYRLRWKVGEVESGEMVVVRETAAE